MESLLLRKITEYFLISPQAVAFSRMPWSRGGEVRKMPVLHTRVESLLEISFAFSGITWWQIAFVQYAPKTLGCAVRLKLVGGRMC